LDNICHYFCVAVGGQERGKNQGRGKILQRFPLKDWDNCPFTQGIELVSISVTVIFFGLQMLWYLKVYYP